MDTPAAPPDARPPKPPAQEASLVRTLDQAIHLPVFEGPLDLLLFLIRRNEVDIYDIPIETVTRQYLEILRGMEALKLEVAGDFFVMAATLMQIKSRMLLPKNERVEQPEEEEEDIDPRWELVQQLIEYRKFKEAAEGLDALIEQATNLVFRDYIPAGEDLPARPVRPTDRIELWNVFNHVLRRLAEKIVVGEIHADTVTVADRMEAILERLSRERRFRFTQLFEDDAHTTLVTIVASFLALLELSRLGQIALTQHKPFADIVCEATDAVKPL